MSAICPLCGEEATGHTHVKNGGWALEPISNFGIADKDDGMVCVEWDSDHFDFYYHSPEDVGGGPEEPQSTKVGCRKSYEERTNDTGVPVEGTVVTCNRCGESEFSFGTSGKSTKRCLALLNEKCPKDQNNYYEVVE